MTVFVPLVLFGSAILALWIGLRVVRRPAAGARQFAALSCAVAMWCATSALHGLAESLHAKIAWARLQYLAIAALPPLWLLFTAEYAGALRLARGAGIWIVPALTIAVAATNEWHGAVWASVQLDASGAAVYTHGWWFWIAAAYSYVLLVIGTALLARMIARSPRPFRAQHVTLIAAAGVPWMGNMLYLNGWRPAGLDLTPLAFAVSTILFAWALYRTHLFDLVPVARDLVVDSLSDAMFVVDGSRRIVDMNAAARQLAASEAAEPIGRAIDDVVPMLASVRLEESAAPLTFAERHYDVRVMPVRRKLGVAAAWVILVRDVTVQHREAAEREALQLRVQEQQRRESLSILAGGMAHDFNNLLAGILGHADLLALKMGRHTEAGSSLGAIVLGAQRAADLVSKMLAYAGERHGSTSRIDLDALTSELLDLLRASAARHCTITYSGEPATIEADPTQIRQVAMNLIINAAEASEEGGDIQVTVGRETLGPEQLEGMRFGQDIAPGEYAFLEVRDQGAGMDEKTLHRLFNPFFTTKPDGHGLGLAAVQGIVLGHRGALQVESRPGAGSTFRVWLPIAEAPGIRPSLAAGPRPHSSIPLGMP